MFSWQSFLNTPPLSAGKNSFPESRSEPHKQVYLYGQVKLYVNQAGEIEGEGRKWQLKRVGDQAQVSFCSSGGGTTLPSI